MKTENQVVKKVQFTRPSRLKLKIRCAGGCGDPMYRNLLYFTEDGQHFHPECYILGDNRGEFEARTRWFLSLITEALQTFRLLDLISDESPTFRAQYEAGKITTRAATGFMPDLERDLDAILAEVRELRVQAAKLMPEETAALFVPINSNSEAVSR